MTSATIGIGSLGTIGSRVAQAIVQDPNLGSLQIVSARDHEWAAQKLRDLGSDAKVVENKRSLRRSYVPGEGRCRNSRGKARQLIRHE